MPVMNSKVLIVYKLFFLNMNQGKAGIDSGGTEGFGKHGRLSKNNMNVMNDGNM